MTKAVSTDWKAALAAQVRQVASKEPEWEGVPQVSLKGGRMQLNDKLIPGDSIQCVILHTRYERAWYNRPYSPDDKSPPDCYALSHNGGGKSDMYPVEGVPNPGNDRCKGCPQAEFGTALRGKGPACKTRLRLAIMPAPDNLKAADFDEPKLAIYLTQPTSTENFDGLGVGKQPVGYEQQLANQGMAPWGVRTEIVLKPHDRKLHETTFVLKGALPEELMPAAFGAIDVAEEATNQRYTYESEEDETEAEKAADAKM